MGPQWRKLLVRSSGTLSAIILAIATVQWLFVFHLALNTGAALTTTILVAIMTLACPLLAWNIYQMSKDDKGYAKESETNGRRRNQLW
jgi:hypothetical protein